MVKMLIDTCVWLDIEVFLPNGRTYTVNNRPAVRYISRFKLIISVLTQYLSNTISFLIR